MIKKMWKPLLVTGMVAAVMTGCSDSKDTAPSDDNNSEKQVAQNQQKEFNFEHYYKLDDKEVVIELNGQKLTVGELKKRSFQQLLLSEVNQFIEKQLVLEKYPVTEEELAKEIKKAGNVQSVDKEQLRYQLSYDKAIRDGAKYTEDDLKKIYNQHFSDSTQSYEEMKKDLEYMAPYYMGAQIHDKIGKLKKDASIKYIDKDLEKQYHVVYPTIDENKKQ